MIGTARIMPRVVRRFLRGERGAAAVEFAIVVPVLLTLVLAIIDFGRLMYVTASLTAAVRDGARLAAVQVDPTAGASLTAVRTRVKTAFQANGGAALTDGQITISAVDAEGAITVGVTNYTYSPITPLAQFTGLGTIRVSRQAVLRWERSS
ncbi:MAG: TadE/TadG family type IV pilus assembly protein [Gemmatirosa sp.]